MNDNPKYRVFPQAASHKNYEDITLSQSERSNAEGLGCGGGGILWVLIVVVLGYVLMQQPSFTSEDNGPLIAAILTIGGASIAVGLLSSAIKNSNVSALKRKKTLAERKRTDEANRSEERRVTSEAENLTSRLVSTYDSSTDLANSIPEHLHHASDWLQLAENEFRDNAYAPFWDAVENAVQHLALYNEKVERLSGNANEYYRQLAGRKHTFPNFPVRLDTVPDPSEEIAELRRIVRLGQTNFEFANIWEHRRTREVLIAGFQTLGAAVSNLGATISASISDLQQSVSSDLARVVAEQTRSVDEQRRTREALNRTLGSIDRRMHEQNRTMDRRERRENWNH